ncbi:ABC transporter ATP-binding protein [Virgibacillus phasianinus]|uniref:ABC transporter ATP-binding protein n=1 Tax=Virgibacillus phasianinus TaxID=2017483 RepID=A0A220TY64_9BACI|nr:ABC transporter ATP-binding protein [Virgibacillus phasianinus]ASK60737.1 ABC transporter ATP-binding protein [Virgibacillus phasianinus]
MKRVFSFLRPYKLPIVVAYSLTMIELATELLLPFFLGLMINQGVVNQDIGNIVMWGSIMIGLAFLALFAGVINSFYASHTSYGFGYDIRERLFEKVQEFSFRNLNQYPTSVLMTRFTNDVRQLQNTIHMGLRVMVKAPLLILGGVVMAFIVNAKLALIFLITVPLLVAFIFWVLKRASRLFRNVQQRVDHVNQVMQENLAGMRLIKAFLRRSHEENRFMKANEDLAAETRYTFRFVEASMPILLFVMNLSLISILWFGHQRVAGGESSVGDIVAIVNYALRVAMAISMLTFITMAFSRAKASATRLGDVLDVKVDLHESEDADADAVVHDGKIDVQHVDFAYYKQDKNVLQDITFSVKARESVAIIGATGAGKTTLFQLLPRLYDVNRGTIAIDDQPITSYTLDHLRRAIGYVPQNPLLFTGSVFDNIAWGKDDATKEEVIQAAKDAQIHETIMELAEDYDTKVGQKGVNLSGGQKQRLSIARALIRRPKILMLDDCTSALDVATESRLLAAIEPYDCTNLMITQKVTTAMDADRILLMDDGRILANGTHQELLEDSTLYRKIVESQFGKEYLHAN